MLDPKLHQITIELILFYTLAGAFVFTVAVTCISLIKPNLFTNPKQQQKLFVVLIVELVIIVVGSFGGFLNFSPLQLQKEIQQPTLKAQQEKIDELQRLYNETRIELTKTLTTIQQIKQDADTEERRHNAARLQQSVQNVTTTFKVVSIHVGNDDGKSDVFHYMAPIGFAIKSFNLKEVSKFGDAHYSPTLVSPTQLDVSWSVKSHTVRGPFAMVVDTKTAQLDLDADVELQHQ